MSPVERMKRTPDTKPATSFVSVKDAAAMLGISRAAVKKAIHESKRLKAVKIGNSYAIELADLYEFKKSREK